MKDWVSGGIHLLSFILSSPINADVNAGVILTQTCREDFFPPSQKITFIIAPVKM